MVERDYNESYGFMQSDHYCIHGTYVGGWAGPDYLCGHCEMGEDVLASWLGVRVKTLMFSSEGQIMQDATRALTPATFIEQQEDAARDYLRESLHIFKDVPGVVIEYEEGTNFGRVTFTKSEEGKARSLTMSLEFYETGGWMTSREALEAIENGENITIQRGQDLVDNLREDRAEDTMDDKLEAHLHQCVEEGVV